MTSNLETDLTKTLVDLGLRLDHRIDCAEIGPPLIAMGYSDRQIVQVLFQMEQKGTIELLSDNSVRLLQALSPE